MKKYLFTLIVCLFLTGCATSNKIQPKMHDKYLSTKQIFDSDKHDVWWLILVNDPVETTGWLIHNHSILFLDDGGIAFLDNEKETVILRHHFNFRLIKFDSWIHADFRDFFDEFVNESKPKSKELKIKPSIVPGKPPKSPKNGSEQGGILCRKVF